MLILLSFDGVHYGDLQLAQLPSLRRIVQKGLFVKRLETVFPSVTWNIHTSVVTGKKPKDHRIYGNEIYDRQRQTIDHYFCRQLGTKEDLIQCETFYDALAKEGKTIASICWPLTQGAKHIEKNIPEFYTQEEFDRFCTPGFYEELKQEGFPLSCYGRWSKEHSLGPLQDSLTEEILEYIIRNRQADVILGHYLLYDSFQHEFGVGSPEAIWALSYVDSLIGRLLDCLEKEGLMEDTQIILFSDHGHSNVTQAFDINRILDMASCSRDALRVANNGGCALLYAIGTEGENQLKEARIILQNHPGVEKIYDGKNMEEIGWSLPEKPDKLFPDIVLALREGWCCAEGELKSKSMHGYNPKTVERMNGFLAACGRGFDQGAVVENMLVTDICDLIQKVYPQKER